MSSHQVILEAVLNGLLVGSTYAGVAVGLSLVFGVLRVINFAHGSFLMVAMYGVFWLWKLLRLDPYISLALVVPACYFFGYLVQKTLITPLFKRERSFVVEPIGALILTSGIWLALDNLALLLFGSNYLALTASISDRVVRVGGAALSLPRIIAFPAAICITLWVAWFLDRTEIGRAIRAVSQNREAAALCGVDVFKVYNVTFGLGCAIVAVAAGILCPFYYVHPTVGTVFGVKSFLVVVLGGLGSITGALFGGLIIGAIESVVGQFVTATSASIVSFAVFILVLLFRPKGLMGRI